MWGDFRTARKTLFWSHATLIFMLGILDSKTFFLRIVKILFHYLIVSIVAVEKFAAILIS